MDRFREFSLRSCWLSAAQPPCNLYPKGPGHRYTPSLLSFARSTQVPQISPTVMKLHQLFCKLTAVFQKEMMKTELPAWGKVFGQLCQGQHAHLMGRDLVLQPREPPTTVGPHLVQLPWTGDSSSPYLLLSAPSVDKTPSKAPSPQLTRGNPVPKLRLKTQARNQHC